jgi:hypothetical protein
MRSILQQMHRFVKGLGLESTHKANGAKAIRITRNHP